MNHIINMIISWSKDLCRSKHLTLKIYSSFTQAYIHGNCHIINYETNHTYISIYTSEKEMKQKKHRTYYINIMQLFKKKKKHWTGPSLSYPNFSCIQDLHIWCQNLAHWVHLILPSMYPVQSPHMGPIYRSWA